MTYLLNHNYKSILVPFLFNILNGRKLRLRCLILLLLFNLNCNLNRSWRLEMGRVKLGLLLDRKHQVMLERGLIWLVERMEEGGVRLITHHYLPKQTSNLLLNGKSQNHTKNVPQQPCQVKEERDQLES